VVNVQHWTACGWFCHRRCLGNRYSMSKYKYQHTKRNLWLLSAHGLSLENGLETEYCVLVLLFIIIIIILFITENCQTAATVTIKYKHSEDE